MPGAASSRSRTSPLASTTSLPTTSVETSGNSASHAGASPNTSAVKSRPSCRNSQALLPSASTTGASVKTAPGTCRQAKASTSLVLSDEVVSVAGTDSRPLLTIRRAKPCCCARPSTAFRNSLLTSLFGVMKSVARVEFRMFSSAANSRSAPYVARSSAPARLLSTQSSFQARFSASCTPLLAPRAPKGDTP